MNPSSLSESSTHKHEGHPSTNPAFWVMVAVSFLALGACTAFAIVMTNGPDYRAAAAPILGSTEVDVGPDGPSADLAQLGLEATVPGGPIVLGEPGKIVVTITNPHEYAVSLDRVEVRVLEPSRPECRAEWLAVDDYTAGVDGAVSVPAQGAASITLRYKLIDLAGTNQDGCKGARFPLALEGSGRRV
jgi:hypothetical protein